MNKELNIPDIKTAHGTGPVETYKKGNIFEEFENHLEKMERERGQTFETDTKVWDEYVRYLAAKGV